MFYQVLVPEKQHHLLRFLWWPNSNLDKGLQEFVITVHIFGAVSSSSANFALKRTATENETTYGTEAADTLRNDFYVDDILKNCNSESEAIELLENVVGMCARGGFRLTKIGSNSRLVLQAVEKDEVGKVFKGLNLDTNVLPIERGLDFNWCIQNDCFGFRITLKDRPLTKRGVLSSIRSLYDPLGLASPFLLQGKLLLQQLCAEKKE